MVDPDDIDQFLDEQPLMALRPDRDQQWRLVGSFRFSAAYPGFPTISDSYDLEIILPSSFPRYPPTLRESAGKIPKHEDFHVNVRSSTLCLGSPLALALRLKQKPSLVGFAETCIVPYLYGMSYRLEHGSFPFGELAHGFAGEWDDYGKLLHLNSEGEILAAFELLGMKKRVANKRRCPCNCGKRLGKCRTNDYLRPLRQEIGRNWFREYLVVHEKIGKLLAERSAATEVNRPAA